MSLGVLGALLDILGALSGRLGNISGPSRALLGSPGALADDRASGLEIEKARVCTSLLKMKMKMTMSFFLLAPSKASRVCVTRQSQLALGDFANPRCSLAC